MNGRRGWVFLAILFLLAVALLVLAWTREVAAYRAEVDAQRRRLAWVQSENGRLLAALTALNRRPQRAQALIVEADMEGTFVGLVNAARVALGRQALAWDEQLAWVADWRARDMAARMYYGHVSPLGETAASVLMGFGGSNSLAIGENIWSCSDWQACESTTIYETFKASPDHRANQELARYDHVGIGVALDGLGRLLVAVLFADQPTVQALAGG